mgnify:CR=1 FL=1
MLNKKAFKMNLQEDYLEELVLSLNPGGSEEEDEGNDEIDNS